MTDVAFNMKQELIITIPVEESCVVKAKGKHYVFVALAQPKIFDLSMHQYGSRRLYNRYMRCVRSHLYNIVRIYGLDAYDIDEPQATVVSVRLEFRVVPTSEGMYMDPVVREVTKAVV